MLQEIIKSKVSTLRSVISFCNELDKTRDANNNVNDLEEVKRFCESQLVSLKHLVDELNNKI